MATTFHTTESSQNINLLYKVAGIFREMVCLLKSSEPERDLKHFYSRFMVLCLLIEDEADRVKVVITPDNLIIDLLLHRFQLLVTAHIQQELSFSPIHHSHSPLRALDYYWNRILDQSQGVKLDFIQSHVDFGSSPEREELLKFLKKRVDLLSALNPEDTSKRPMYDYALQRKTRNEPSYAVWAAAQALYEALVASKDCTCKPTHEYDARLCLGTYRKPGLHEDLDFDMFLALEQFWQEVHVHTVKESRVKFALTDKTEQVKTKKLGSDRMRVKELCKQMKKVKKMSAYRLQFMVENRQLWKLQSKPSSSSIDRSKAPVSLEQFIAERSYSLTEKTKRILAVLLSYTVLHFYGTPWLQSTWGSSSIIFFQTESSAIPLKPFIHVQLVQDHACSSLNASAAFSSGDDRDFDPDNNDPDGDDPDDLLTRHLCPCLINLATMLIEVYFATPFQNLAKKYSVDLGGAGSNIRYLEVLQVVRKCECEIPENSQFRLAVNNCLKQDLWEDADSERLDEQTLRSVVYQEVVRPLEDELNQAFSYISIENLDSFAQNLDIASWGHTMQNQQTNGRPSLYLPVEPYGHPNEFAPPNRPQYIAGSQQHTQHKSAAWEGSTNCGHRTEQMIDRGICRDVDYKSFRFFDDETPPQGVSDEARKQYKDWKKKFKAVYEEFSPERLQSSSYTPVKIAVLDTGVDLKHSDMIAREDQIKDVYNWIDDRNEKDVRDRSGHGTHTAGLLLDYACEAELYVAKIAEKKPPEPRIIAAAIKHAVTHWKVDVISMSFGFPNKLVEGYKELEEAIREAYDSDVLLFAAASNSGANLGRAYPARHREVICIHSTDANGNRSKFSPTAITNDDNFATVGEAVESAWPEHLSGPKTTDTCVAYKSGTSFATPIAAGIAAFLLQYSRLHLSGKQAEMLKRSSGMKAVLKKIAKMREGHTNRDGYDYIALSRCSDNLFGKREDHIKCSIVDALESSP